MRSAAHGKGPWPLARRTRDGDRRGGQVCSKRLNPIGGGGSGRAVTIAEETGRTLVDPQVRKPSGLERIRGAMPILVDTSPRSSQTPQEGQR